MHDSFEGDHDAGGLKIAVIASRFNDEIVSGLLAGAVECLVSHGAAPDAIDTYRVPGAFELPVLAGVLAVSGKYEALIAIGVLIRGDTPHFEYISSSVTSMLATVAVEAKLPVSYGVITCNTMEQARERSGTGSGNKGWEAALAAIEMANLLRALR